MSAQKSDKQAAKFVDQEGDMRASIKWALRGARIFVFPHWKLLTDRKSVV